MNYALFSITCLGLLTFGVAATPGAAADPMECGGRVCDSLRDLCNAKLAPFEISCRAVFCVSFHVVPNYADWPTLPNLASTNKYEWRGYGWAFQLTENSYSIGKSFGNGYFTLDASTHASTEC